MVYCPVELRVGTKLCCPLLFKVVKVALKRPPTQGFAKYPVEAFAVVKNEPNVVEIEEVAA
jgi:hypothetical protein